MVELHLLVLLGADLFLKLPDVLLLVVDLFLLLLDLPLLRHAFGGLVC